MGEENSQKSAHLILSAELVCAALMSSNLTLLHSMVIHEKKAGMISQSHDDSGLEKGLQT